LQRILARGDIESLDHTTIPRLRLPVRASIFADRAARFRSLAAGNPVGAYLNLMAGLADAQHQALRHAQFPGASAQQLALAQGHGMPVLPALGGHRDPGWQGLLAAILDHMLVQDSLPAEARVVVQALRRKTNTAPHDIDTLADALLAQHNDCDRAAAPFVMAALQVYWTSLAADIDARQMPVASPFGVCPVCGTLPVASVVRVGGQADSCRYLCCPLCSTEWHLVRVTCSHCENTKNIGYHAIEGGPDGIKAESCDHCHTYRKIFYQEKALGADPVADDLASLTLDMLMGEAGYSRASGNPFLWQDTEPA